MDWLRGWVLEEKVKIERRIQQNERFDASQITISNETVHDRSLKEEQELRSFEKVIKEIGEEDKEKHKLKIEKSDLFLAHHKQVMKANQAEQAGVEYRAMKEAAEKECSAVKAKFEKVLAEKEEQKSD